MPDPQAARQQEKNRRFTEQNSSTDSESQVPVPVRYLIYFVVKYKQIKYLG